MYAECMPSVWFKYAECMLEVWMKYVKGIPHVSKQKLVLHKKIRNFQKIN